MSNYVSPTINENAFNCPHCGAYAHQVWHRAAKVTMDMQFFLTGATPSRVNTQISDERLPKERLPDTVFSTCQKCEKYAIWVEGKLVYPPLSTAPLPVDDMPSDVKDDYLEARNIVNASPRGAAALLRLALQKLLIFLGEKGQKIDDDIKSLVKKSLPEEIQQALDALRVIGNNAIHPGQIDITDDVDTATALFALLNFIVDRMITQPKQVGAIYNMLPASAQAAIKKRDGKP